MRSRERAPNVGLNQRTSVHFDRRCFSRLLQDWLSLAKPLFQTPQVPMIAAFVGGEKFRLTASQRRARRPCSDKSPLVRRARRWLAVKRIFHSSRIPMQTSGRRENWPFQKISAFVYALLASVAELAAGAASEDEHGILEIDSGMWFGYEASS